jgi:hypothetical protein
MIGRPSLVDLLSGHDPATDPPFILYHSNEPFVRGERDLPTFPPIDSQIQRSTPIVIFCLIVAIALGTFLYPSIITFFGTGVTTGQITNHLTLGAGTHADIPVYFTLYSYSVAGTTYNLREPSDPSVAERMYNGGTTVRVRYMVQIPGIATMVDPTNTYPANETPLAILGAMALFALILIFAVVLLHRQGQARHLRARRRAAWHMASVIDGQLISCVGRRIATRTAGTSFIVTAQYRYTAPDTGEVIEGTDNLDRPSLRDNLPLPGRRVRIVYYPKAIRFRGRAVHEFML